MPLAPGTVLGHYEILAAIGAGGMGEVYRARDNRLGREVALKLLLERPDCDHQVLERFQREAQSASALNHPNICIVHDIGEHEGRRYLVLELLTGETLQARLLDGPLPASEVVELAAQIADALSAAHSHSIVHRDIKPANIFLTVHGAKVLDFGLAKATGSKADSRTFSLAGGDFSPDAETSVAGAASQHTGLTSPGHVVGTLFYMSPEQALGKPVDPRSDLFALGAVVHEMATGRRAFPGSTPAAVFDAILNRAPDGALPPAISGLAPILERLLAKAPGGRFESAAEATAALRRLANSGELARARGASNARREARREPPSIAVLPFLNLSADPENEYFTDGITEEILGALSKVTALRVASRTSSFAFKGKREDVRAIGRALGVATILEGSVRRSGPRMRVSVQLVKAEDGYQLWSDRFDREVADIFAVQDEISEKVATALRVVLSERERKEIRRIPTENLEAYDNYLRGRDLLRILEVESFPTARKLFEHAVELDESFVPAWLGIVESCFWLFTWAGRDPELLAPAKAAAERALDIAPDLAEAHVAQGLTCFMVTDNAGAHRAFERAVELDPKNFDAYYYDARTFVSEGRFDAAAPRFEQASEVRPEDYQSQTLLVQTYKALGKERESRVAAQRALAIIERHLELQPGDVRAMYFAAGNTMAVTGDRAKALHFAHRALETDPTSLSVRYNVACFYATIGMNDEALTLLDENVRQGWGQKDWIEHDPDWTDLREDPRFRAIVGRIQA
ncbi:MAG: protein kinase [Thermoanaerobaculia bacterium]